MNTSLRSLFKVAGVYILAQIAILLVILGASLAVLHFLGIDQFSFQTRNPVLLFVFTVVIITLLLTPPIIAGSSYYRFSRTLPDGETRLTLAMIISGVACLLSLPLTAGKTDSTFNRLFAGDLFAHEIAFALVAAAATYVFHLIVALIGVRIGLRLTRRKFVAA